MTKRIGLFALVAALAVMGLTSYGIPGIRDEHGGAAHVHAATGPWSCPMHPDVTSDAPGKCPKCGMDLVTRDGPAPNNPAEAGSGDRTPRAGGRLQAEDIRRGDITIDGRRQQLIGVRTARVRRIDVRADIRAAGLVRYDETRQAEVNLKVDGWIRELYANYTGKVIRRGDPLFTLYSPDLLATQNEYLLARKSRAQASESRISDVQNYSDRLLAAARQRLLLWDVTSSDVEQLERTGEPRDTLTFRSPVTGFIVEKAAVEGMRVMAGQMLFRVADLSTVWVEADVQESDVTQVRRGTPAIVSVDAYPGETFRGRVTYLYPELTGATRTARVRLELPNRDGRLKPNMFATVVLSAPPRSAMVVPVDAVVDNGKEQVVFLAQGEGYFVPQAVRAGRRVDGDVEILAGLADGDEVAGAATFFIDSESQLRGALSAYAPQSGGHEGDDAPPRTSTMQIELRTDPDPPRSGENRFEIHVRDAQGTPVTDAAVSLVLYMPPMPSMNMPAMRSDVTLSHAGAGIYRGEGHVHMAGRWDATMTVARNGLPLGRKETTLIAR